MPDKKPSPTITHTGTSGIIDAALNMSTWKLVLIGVGASEIFTFFVSTVQYLTWWPHSFDDLINAGILDAFVVSAVVCTGLVYMIGRLREAKASVAAEKSKVEAMLAGIGERLSIIDRDFAVVYQNEVSRSRYGVRTGEQCYTAFFGSVVSCLNCPVEKCYEDGKVHRLGVEVLGTDGPHRLEITASPLVGPDGSVSGSIEMVRDVTEDCAVEPAPTSVVSA